MEKLLREIVRRILKAMNLHACEIFLLKDGYLVPKVGIGIPKKIVKELKLKIGKGITGHVFKQGRVIAVSNVPVDSHRAEKSIARQGKFKSYLGAPIVIDGKKVGVLSLYKKTIYKFKPTERELFTALASQASLAIANAILYEKAEKSLVTGYFNTIRALAAVIDAKDAYTYNHSKKVMQYAVAIAKEMRLSESEVKAIKYASFVHDLGKIGIDANILQKPSKLTLDEFANITEHARLGSDIVEHVSFLRDLVPIILHHHERYDGRGYPSGLKKKRIPMGARILGVVDSYEAMISDRPYRKAIGKRKAMAELKKCSGTQFDPEIVKIFLQILKKNYQK